MTGAEEIKELGKYHIVKLLGEGAMGKVYLGEHRLLKVCHALKVLPSEVYETQGFEERLHNEACIMAMLQHPNIVKVHDLDRDDVSESYFFSMDFISPDEKHSQTLEELLAQNSGRLAYEQVKEMLCTLCQAVAYAHDKGILHCDIKPSNILLGKKGVIYLSDFGLAKIVGQKFIAESIRKSQLYGKKLGEEKTLTDSNSVAGTFLYMPPEVQIGEQWTRQGDIYSLGVLAYYMLTGKYPQGRWKLPSEIFNEIPAEWDEFTEKALQQEPKDRYKTIPSMEKAIPRKGDVSRSIFVSKEEKGTLEYCRKAAEQGDATAQCNLGWMYAHGHGVPKNDEESAKWYRKAAEQGNATAQCNLGWMYAHGYGVPKNDEESTKWYRKAAERGTNENTNGLL